VEPRNMTSEDEETEVVELTEEEQEILEQEESKAAAQRQDTLDSLASKIEAKFKTRAVNRATKESEWIECMRLYLGGLGNISGSYGESPFTDSPKERGKRRPDFNIVQAKCDTAIAQCVSMQFATGEKNWDIFPAADETDEANVLKSRGMSKKIETQLDKCGYGFQCRRAMTDRVILGTGVVKGPVNTGKLYKHYEDIGDNTWVPKVGVNYDPAVMWVNTWFFYPDDSVNDFSKAQDAIEIHPMSKLELSQYRKHDGFDAEAIEEVLKQAPADYMNANFAEYAKLTDSNPYLFKDKYAVLEYQGPITSSELDELGIEPTYDSPTDEYYGEVWVCQGKVLRIELENIEASFEIPYAVATWKKDPSSVYGFGQPLTMRDAQRVVTQTWHMILDNSSLSSGPQGAIQKRFIQPADGVWELGPRKMWNLTDPMMKVQDAISFFNVPNVTQQIIPVLQMAREFAEEESNTPLISAGLGSPQNSESATGQLITQQNSTTLLDFLAEEWDDQITQKVISRMYAWNMQYASDPAIKGNYVIDVRSSTEYKNKQQHVRDVERLSMEMQQNPALAKWINPDALTKLRLEMMHLPTKTIIRTPEEVAQIEAQMAQQPNPEMIELQIKQKEAEGEEQDRKLKAMQLQFEIHQQQQRESWEHEEKMSANYARTLEAQAMVLRSQNEKETEMIKLAAKSEDERMKADYLLQANLASNQTKVFLKSMEETRKARENLLVQQELDLAKSTGEGI
jgi:hypothetical protein